MSRRFARVSGLAALLSVALVACGEAVDVPDDESPATEVDAFTLTEPRDMKIALVDGQWIRDQRLTRGTDGFHLYRFTAPRAGLVLFRMEAKPGDPQLTSYLRVIDPAKDRERFAQREQWASHGHAKTNVCDVMVDVEAGRTYEVVATSNQNTDEAAERSDGPYALVAFYATRRDGRTPLAFP